MKPFSVRQAQWFTPDGADYRVLVGPLTQREEMEVLFTVSDKRGPQITSDEIRQYIRDGVMSCYDPEDQAASLAVVTEFEAALVAAQTAEKACPPGATNGDVPTEVREAREVLGTLSTRLLTLQRVVARRYPPLAELLTHQERSITDAMIERIRFGVRDWENVVGVDGQPLPCVRRDGKLTEPCFDMLPLKHWLAISSEISGMTTLTEADVGESVSPSGAPGTPTSPSMG